MKFALGRVLPDQKVTREMTFAPRWPVARRLMASELVFLPLAASYCFLLSHSWEPDTLSLILPGSLRDGFKGGFNPQFIPKLQGIMSLFSRMVTAASLWVHLLSINLFAARSAYLQGLQDNFPTRHTVILCSLFGPLGLLSGALTKKICQRTDGDLTTSVAKAP
ncbi:probable protein ABA DEFICIENT 4, chloroplastic [Coccomyxa sp. Obi]|nr:probable protein ABA DEFICIENT 4, chloroplastic [Coccomyxa sp. Obi]